MSELFPADQRARAVNIVLDHLNEYRSVYTACPAIGPKVVPGYFKSLSSRLRKATTNRGARPRPQALTGPDGTIAIIGSTGWEGTVNVFAIQFGDRSNINR